MIVQSLSKNSCIQALKKKKRKPCGKLLASSAKKNQSTRRPIKFRSHLSILFSHFSDITAGLEQKAVVELNAQKHLT